MPDLLTSYANSQPAKPAVIEDNGIDVLRWSYAELEARSNRMANALVSLGAGPGQRVLWCGPNSAQVVAVICAARKIGAIAVPLNYRLAPEEALHIIGHSDAPIAVVAGQQAQLFEVLRDSLRGLKHVIVFSGVPPHGMLGDDFVAGFPVEPPAAADEASIAGATGAMMIYTSGTTGKPKGAVRHGLKDERAIYELYGMIGYTPDDVYLTSGPLYHGGPSGFMSVALALGQTVVVQRKFEPQDWLRLVQTYRVSSSFAAPAVIRMVCALPDSVKSHFDRSSMRRMIANAAPWSLALKQRYLADFPDDSLWEIYASTELGINTVLEPKDQLRKPGSCGRPAPGVEIRLIDREGNDVTGTGPDHPGELYVRSPSMFDEYYKAPDSYSAASLDGFLTVGDIAYRDDEGYYYICDRKNDMIISGGMNVYPAEVEAVLEQHPAIYDAAVFGIPSAEWGETVHATVVLAPGASLTEAEVTAFAREHLAGYKIPRSVAFAAELPRTGSGKLLKRVLRAPYWAGQDRPLG